MVHLQERCGALQCSVFCQKRNSKLISVDTPTCKRGLARSVLDFYIFLLTIPHLTSDFSKMTHNILFNFQSNMMAKMIGLSQVGIFSPYKNRSITSYDYKISLQVFKFQELLPQHLVPLESMEENFLGLVGQTDVFHFCGLKKCLGLPKFWL